MRRLLLIIVTVAAGITGCVDGVDDIDTRFEPEPRVDFTTLVKDEFAATADNTGPLEVDEAPLSFNDLDNPSAYDDLLQ